MVCSTSNGSTSSTPCWRGAAPEIEALIIGRVIAGVGASGMYSGTLTYVSVISVDQEKPAYLVGSTAVWGVGSFLGPVARTFDCSILLVSVATGWRPFAASSVTWRWMSTSQHPALGFRHDY
jgi:MFS family permease